MLNKERLKYLLMLIIIILGLGCSGTRTAERHVINQYKKEIPEDNFYFDTKLERVYTLGTNIKYRGALYSDELKRMGSVSGIPVILTSEKQYISPGTIRKRYSSALANRQGFINREAKKIFGDEIITNYAPSAITVIKFVPDTLALNTKEEIWANKEKMKKLYQELRRGGASGTLFLAYVDEKNFKRESSLKRSLAREYRENPRVKSLIRKVKNKKELTKEERQYLMDRMDGFGGHELYTPPLSFKYYVETEGWDINKIFIHYIRWDEKGRRIKINGHTNR